MLVKKLRPSTKAVGLLEAFAQDVMTSRPPAQGVSFAAFDAIEIPEQPSKKEASPGCLRFDEVEKKDIGISELRELIQADRVLHAKVMAPESLMDWTTDSAHPGSRVCFSWSKDGGAIFRYYDYLNKQIVNFREDPGWNVFRFEVRHYPPLWRTLWTPGLRFSIEFNTPFI